MNFDRQEILKYEMYLRNYTSDRYDEFQKGNQIKRKMFTLLFMMLSLLPVQLQAQELTVKSFTEKTNDLAASMHLRTDNNGEACALVKVQLATAGAQFSPNVVGKVDYKVNEYWVYLPTINKHLEVRHPDYLTIDVKFSDYGFKTLEPKATYSLVLQQPMQNSKDITVFVKGLPIKMVYVEGGRFNKGDGTPVQEVKSFYMSQTEVTGELWPFNKPDKKPVVYASWRICQDFISSLNKLTGLSFRMPAETEWEYAARGGKHGHGYKYSGSDNLGEIAYYGQASGPSDVAQRKANELGIYDMSGNVWEWCNNYCDGSIVNDPAEVTNDTEVVARGGGWYSKANRCTVDSRICQEAGSGRNFVGLRLVLDDNTSGYEDSAELTCDVTTCADSIVLAFGDFRIPLLYVEGGTFKMGATAEQTEFAAQDESPVHKVRLDAYYMSKEKLKIPKRLCKKLGIWCEGKSKEDFTYKEALSLVDKISKASNLHLSLPTEAEWEYAARGGQHSRGYIYSGTNVNYDDHELSLTANELGLIGMSEGEAEWTCDTYSEYTESTQNDNDNIVVRGGEKINLRRRVSARIQTVSTDENAIRLVVKK